MTQNLLAVNDWNRWQYLLHLPFKSHGSKNSSSLFFNILSCFRIDQIPDIFFETTWQIFGKFCIAVSRVSWQIMHLQISSLNRVYFGQTKRQVFRFSTGNVKFTIILLSFSKVTVTVSANLASFLSNMTHNLVLSFVERVNCLDKKFSQQFHFLTLKGHGKFGPKLNPAFQITPRHYLSAKRKQ